ncbi:hypothetical protein, partial [Vulgatibacter sp.]|uniref:hypothetical protein n=1 Tax=Vulgatibacter sp. TaxID=1971226 RepID=UPI00356340BA
KSVGCERFFMPCSVPAPGSSVDPAPGFFHSLSAAAERHLGRRRATRLRRRAPKMLEATASRSGINGRIRCEQGAAP